MNVLQRLFGKGVEVNPDVTPQTALDKSVVRFWLFWLLGVALNWVLGKLGGLDQWWVPWAMGALRGVLDVLRATYKVDPRPPADAEGS